MKNKKGKIEIEIRKILYEKMDSFLVEGDKPREIGRLNLDRHLFVDTTTALILELLKSEEEKWSEKILKKMKCRKRNHEDQLCGGCNDCNTYQKLKEEIKKEL